MLNYVKITIAQLGEYNEIQQRKILLNAFEIAEILEPLSRPDNLDKCYGGCCENYHCIVIMTNGYAFKAIESLEEIVSQLPNES